MIHHGLTIEILQDTQRAGTAKGLASPLMSASESTRHLAQPNGAALTPCIMHQASVHPCSRSQDAAVVNEVTHHVLLSRCAGRVGSRQLTRPQGRVIGDRDDQWMVISSVADVRTAGGHKLMCARTSRLPPRSSRLQAG